jgi:hypothetical protein
VVFHAGVLAMFVSCPLHLGYKLLYRIGFAKKGRKRQKGIILEKMQIVRFQKLPLAPVAKGGERGGIWIKNV